MSPWPSPLSATVRRAVRLGRPASVKVIGDDNSVVVRRGTTNVVVRGTDNVLRVHRRA